MRIATLQQYNIGLNGILRNQADVSKTQQEISTGKRVLTPADDPVAATKILQMQQELALNDQYTLNMNAADNRLKAEEAAIKAVTESLAKLKELASSATGAKTLTDRQAIAAEVYEIQEHLADLFNSKDAGGEYIFAGFKGQNQPFVKGANGRYEFVGDEGQRKLAIGRTTTVATGDSGKELFINIPASKNTFVANASPKNKGDLLVNPSFVTDEEKYAEFYPHDLIITFNPASAVTPPESNFTVRRASDNRVVDGMANVTFNPGDNITVAGVTLNIQGFPEPGDQVLVNSTPKQSITDTIFLLTTGLNTLPDTKEGNDTLAILIHDTLTNLTHAEAKISAIRSDLGARMNIVQNTRDLAADVKVVNREILSKLQDADYAESISKLSLQTYLLEAAQQSYTKISRMSLFNHM